MIALDNGDKIRGDASAATVVDYTLHGIDNNAIKQMADGQLAAAIGDLYTADSVDVVSSIILVNTDSSARTVNLYITPSGGSARRLIPKNMSLGVGYSLHTDGKTVTVTDLTGGVVTTIVALSNASPNTIEPDDTASAGTGTAASRADHEHAIVGAAPGTNITPEQANAEGSATSFARSDHMHYIPSGTPSTIGSANSEGTGTAFARTDHIHNREHAIYVDASAVSAVEAAGLTFAENKGIILDALLSADEKWSGISEIGTMGYAATVGDLVYLAVADTKWELAKADVASTSKGKIGIVLATTNENSTCQVLLYGKMRSAAFPAFTVGAPVHISAATAGDVVVTAPTGTTDFVVRIIGYGNTAEDLFFCPDNTYVELA